MNMKLPDFGDVDVVFLTTYGSHLYGTNTPESDMDLKGVFLPPADQILMGKVPKTLSFSTKSSAKDEKNTKDDVDCELYSFGYFVDLACSGQTVAMEMLWACATADHSPFPPQPDHVLVFEPVFDDVVSLRDKFITKNMKAFMGYAKGQAVRYSLKGDKLNTAKDVVGLLEQDIDAFGKNAKLNAFMQKYQYLLENDKNVQFLKDVNGVKMMEVCRRSLQETVSLQYARDVMQNVVDTYGTRAKAAADHDGADFKALSHAVRVTHELYELYTTGKLSFPFDDQRVKMLKEMKRGDWTVEAIMENLEVWMNLVEKMTKSSDYPEKVDRKHFDKIVLDAYKNVVLDRYNR